MSDWRPIATAPKDCPRLLLWCADAHNADDETLGRVVFGRTYGDGEVRGEGMHGAWLFTHWMPLPEPPNPGESK